MTVHDPSTRVHAAPVRFELGASAGPATMPPIEPRAPRVGEQLLDEAAATLEAPDNDGADETPTSEPAVEVLLVCLRDGLNWRARATRGDRVVVREGDDPEELVGLAVGAVRTDGPATAPPEDQAARRARVEARRPLLGRAAECDGARAFVGFLRGAEAAAAFYALAGEAAALHDYELEGSKLACGVDVLVWQAVRKLSARMAAAVLLAALLRARLAAFSFDALCVGGDALGDFPEHWTPEHAWSALWLAAAAEPTTLPGFAAMATPETPTVDEVSSTEELLVQLVFLAYAEGRHGCARGVLDVCGVVARHVGGDGAAMLRFLNTVQDVCETRRGADAPEELVDEDGAPDDDVYAAENESAAAAVDEIDARGWLAWYREAGVNEAQIDYVRRWPPRADGRELGVSDVLSFLEILASAAGRPEAQS